MKPYIEYIGKLQTRRFWLPKVVLKVAQKRERSRPTLLPWPWYRLGLMRSEGHDGSVGQGIGKQSTVGQERIETESPPMALLDACLTACGATGRGNYPS